ncbi:MAG: response regulator [Pseudomonadota bacterium]
MPVNHEMKILVVDDMSTMRKIIRAMLIKCGFKTVVETDDGATAWPIIQDAVTNGVPFDFIISDWNMPQMSGLDLLKKVRALDTTKKIPFLMVTAEAEQANVVTAVQAGVSNYIVKPFSQQTLKEKIDKIFP